jgi:mercuric ion binding protein
MKKIQLFITLVAFSLFAISCSQVKGTDATFATEIFCDHCETCESCKGRVENALKATDGINKADMSVSAKAISVSYDPSKINENQIKVAISKTGFSAGDVPADPAAYDNLDDCCKKKE